MELIAQDRALLEMAEQMSGVGCWRYDVLSGKVIWSPEVFRIHGLLVGSPVPAYDELLRLYEPGDAATLASMVERAIRTGQGYELEAHVRRPDGEVRNVLAKAQCIMASNGAVASICGVFQDVSERVSAERLVRVLGEHLPGMVAYWDADLKCRFANGAYQEWFGRSPSEMNGIGLAELLGPALYAANEPYIRAALSGTLQVFERAIEKPGGQIGHTLVQYVPDRDREGNTTGMYVLIADVGSLKEAELAALAATSELEQRNAELLATTVKLEESNRLLELAEEHALVGHWRYDPARQQLDWSDEVFRLHGRDKDFQPTLEDSLSGYHPEDRPSIERMVSDALTSGTAFSFEARIVQPGGQLRWVASKGVAERDSANAITGLFGIIQDVTEQVGAKELLIRSRETVEHALEAKATFTATVTHEIRTPLTTILSCAALLRTAADPAQIQNYLSKLERSTQLLATIVDDVLLSSRLADGAIPPEDIPFDLHRLASETLKVFGEEASRKGLQLLLTSAPMPPMRGDPARIQRIITNLIGNALKFTEAGSVRVELGRPDGNRSCRVDVVDTGIGVPLDRQKAIFEPFIQAHSSTTRLFGGTGLGLSICQQLVNGMGGSIGVESTVGVGSCFWFEFPLRPVVADASPVEGGLPMKSLSAPCHHVLIAEDNDMNRELICDLVRQLGHKVTAVSNGADAVEAVKSSGVNPFDIVILDIQMPVLDGIDATLRLRALDPGLHLPIYALTAHCSTSQRTRALAVGIDGILDKPIDMDELSSVISLLGTSHSAKEKPTKPAIHTTLDLERLRTMERVLGADQRDRLLDLAIIDLRHCPELVRSLALAGDWDELDRSTHRLLGTAGSIGADEVIAALTAFQTLSASPDHTAQLIEALDQSAANAVRALLLVKSSASIITSPNSPHGQNAAP